MQAQLRPGHTQKDGDKISQIPMSTTHFLFNNQRDNKLFTIDAFEPVFTAMMALFYGVFYVFAKVIEE